jgi:hypothetical protein
MHLQGTNAFLGNAQYVTLQLQKGALFHSCEGGIRGGLLIMVSATPENFAIPLAAALIALVKLVALRKANEKEKINKTCQRPPVNKSDCNMRDYT